MVVPMPIKKGQKPPEKLKSAVVRAVVALLKKATDGELLIVRGLLLAELGARDAAASGSSLLPDTPRNRCVMALDRADLKCRIAYGHGLVTMRDYTEAMKDQSGAPSANWIARCLGGGSWPKAFDKAGIGLERYLEPILVRGSGSRNRPGSGDAWSDRELDEELAQAIEINHGYRLTKEAWHVYCDLASWETPTYATLLRVRYVDGKRVGGITLADCHDRAEALILREPKRFPLAARRLHLVVAVRTAEARSSKGQRERGIAAVAASGSPNVGS